MSTYKEIKGFKVQTLASDTAASVASTGTWASAPNANKAREEMGAGGSATAAIVFGGSGPPSDSPRTRGETEVFDGSSWSEKGDLPTVQKNQAGAGSTTSALSSAGQDPANTNSGIAQAFNGVSWTEVAEVGTARRQLCGMGASNTAALITMGYTTTRVTLTESWDGSSWSEVGEANTGRLRAGSFGSYTSGIVGGGEPASGGGGSESESWNGNSWTVTSTLNTARKDMSSHGAGTSNVDGLIMAGYTTTNVANTEFWDGASWTELADLSTAFRNGFGSQQGSSASAIAGIGFSSTYGVQTELWTTTPAANFQKTNLGQVYYNSGSNAFKVTEQPIPGGTWASSGALNTGRGNAGSAGTQTAALFFGGDAPALTPETVTKTEKYDGTSWTEVSGLNVARSQQFFSNQGTQTAALSATGNPVATKVESWNGASWTESTALNTGRRNGASFGTEAAMLGTGGYNTAYQTLAEEWNGSSWTEVANCPDPKFISRGGGGTTTAGIIAGSYPNGDVDSSQLWNGSAWTNGPNINTGRSGIAFSATSQSSALAHGGGVGAPQAASALTEFYNGTSWSELNDMAQGSQSGGGAGNSVAGIHMGGYGPGSLTTTEEWTVPEANKTITVS